MSDTKISDAVGTVVPYYGSQSAVNWTTHAPPIGTKLYLHPQPAELVEQQVGEVQGERERFEAWAHPIGYRTENQDGYYSRQPTRLAWDVWQAALAARQPADYHGDVDLKWLSGSIGEVAHRLRTYMPHLAEWTDRARDCGIAAKVLEELAARQPGAQEPFGWWLQDDNSVGYFSRTMQPAALYAHRTTPGYSATPLYAAPTAQVDHPYQRIAGLQGIGDAADYLVRHPGDNYAQRHLSERIAEFCQKHGVAPAQGIDLAARPMDTAPRDGTLVRLLVDFEENAIEDSISATWTIGACNDDNVSEGARIGWQFAGWCWTHDHFTEGTGTPVGWLPLIDGQRDAASGVDRGE